MPGAFGAETFTEDAKGRTEPWGSVGLDVLLGAIGEMYEQVQEIVRDGSQPGWTVPLTLSEAKELDWLGQFLGVRREPIYSDADFRRAIDEVAGFSRGTPSSLRNAAYRTLTGARHVNFYERLGGDAYNLTVITYVPETPDPAATEAAIRALKPAGIVLTYICVDGLTYAQLTAEKANYTAVNSSFADYNELRDYLP